MNSRPGELISADFSLFSENEALNGISSCKQLGLSLELRTPKGQSSYCFKIAMLSVFSPCSTKLIAHA